MHVIAAPDRVELGEQLADQLSGEVTTYERTAFPDGELHLRIEEAIAGTALVVGDTRPNERIVETLLALDAAREAGADAVHLAAPYLAYARQDRAFEHGEAVSSRAVMQAVGSLADGLCTVDVHDERVLEYLPGPAVSQAPAPEVATALAEREVSLVLAPDEGALSRAKDVADRLDVPHDHLEKTRLSGSEVEIKPKQLDVADSTVAIVDDIIATGGTMATAARQLLDQGATTLVVAATHGVFVSGAANRLDDAGVDEILVTDAIPSDRSSITCAGALARGARTLQQA